MHRLLPVAVLLFVLGLAGCPSDSCLHIGEACSNFQFCCVNDGLLCQVGARGGFCSKGCRCHGPTICTPSSFEEGCPQGSVCLATDVDGKGQCIVLCNQSPCEVGQYQCETGDAGEIRCAEVPAVPADGGAVDLAPPDLPASRD